MPSNIPEIALPLIIAAVLGAVVGLDRELRHQSMGLRTFILVSTGSALFTLLVD
jgi:putative Mg2+ transporter-C (MgtC) family protein